MARNLEDLPWALCHSFKEHPWDLAQIDLLVPAKGSERRCLRECQTFSWDIQNPCEEAAVIPIFTDEELI